MKDFDLTEKLKELLMGCDVGHRMDGHTFHATADGCYLADPMLGRIAQQLAPEIEKMLPRWIPVSERLPDEGRLVDLWYDAIRYENMFFHVNEGAGYFLSVDTCTICFVSDKKTTHWTPIMKGPMG